MDQSLMKKRKNEIKRTKLSVKQNEAFRHIKTWYGDSRNFEKDLHFGVEIRRKSPRIIKTPKYHDAFGFDTDGDESDTEPVASKCNVKYF